MPLRLPDDQAGCPARQPGHFSCFAKRSNQEKATPMMAVRAARGLHTPPAPKSGSVRNSLRSDNGRFFIRFRRRQRVAIDGDPHVKSNVNGNVNGNGRCAGLTATATVAAGASDATKTIRMLPGLAYYTLQIQGI